MKVFQKRSVVASTTSIDRSFVVIFIGIVLLLIVRQSALFHAIVDITVVIAEIRPNHVIVRYLLRSPFWLVGFRLLQSGVFLRFHDQNLHLVAIGNVLYHFEHLLVRVVECKEAHGEVWLHVVHVPVLQ